MSKTHKKVKRCDNMNNKVLDVLLCENSASRVRKLDNGAMIYHYDNMKLLNKDVNFINIAFDKVVYSIFVDECNLMIVNC